MTHTITHESEILRDCADNVNSVQYNRKLWCRWPIEHTIKRRAGIHTTIKQPLDAPPSLPKLKLVFPLAF